MAQDSTTKDTGTSSKTQQAPEAAAGDPLNSTALALDNSNAAPNEIVPFSEDERRKLPVRERQFPALVGAPDVEVGERTIDNGDEATHVAEPTPIHVKDFVTLKRDYDTEGHDRVHARNITAVRQYMVNQGLRPDADVRFASAKELGGPAGRESISLRYEVHAVPAVIASEFDTRHTVISQDGPTPTERAEFDARREERLQAGYAALREGTLEGERTGTTAGEVRPQDSDTRGEPQKKATTAKSTS